MRILYDNLIDDLASANITAATANAAYPVANLQDQRLSTKWRSTAVTAGSAVQTLTIDLGETKKINTAAILGHNIDFGYFQNIQRLGSETLVRSLVSLGSGVVLAGTGPTGQIYKSTDSGDSWANIQRLGSETDVLSFTSLGSGVVLAGTFPTGQIYKSTDSGDSWANIQRLGSETQVYSLVSLGSGVVLAGTSPTGQIYKSQTYLTISGNATDVWTSPSVTETLLWNEEVILKYFDEQHYRYWQFSIANSTNEDAFIEAGRIWLGDYLDISPSSLLDFKVSKKRSDTVIHGKDRHKFSVIGVGWRRFELSFPPTEEDMIKSLTTMFDAVGNHSSMIFCNFDTMRSYQLVEPCYVSIDGDLEFTHTRRMVWTYNLALEEER